MARRYTNILDVTANTLKTSGNGTTLINNADNSELRSLKGTDSKLIVGEGSGADSGAITLQCAINLRSVGATGEHLFSPDSASPDFQFRRLVAGQGMEIVTSETDAASKNTLRLNCLVPTAGTVTLTSSSSNGEPLIGTDSGGLTLKLKSLVSSNGNLTLATDATGKEISLTSLITRNLEVVSILSTGPWGISEARLSIADKDASPVGWLPALLPIRMPTLYWNGTLLDAVANPAITLSTVGYFNTIMHGLPSGIPFDMYATVMCTTAFQLSFVFHQMAGGSVKKWNAVLSNAVGITDGTMQRIKFTTSVVTPDGVTFSTETVPRPLLHATTTSPESVYATVNQTTTGIYPSTGVNVWILGIDFVFG
jgi:hypothetical protein